MTYEFRNVTALQLLHPAMQIKVRQLLERLREVGENVLITDARRTSEEQDELYAQGRTKPGMIVTHVDDSNSFHTHGLAIDIVPVGPLGVPLDKRHWLEWTALHRYENIAREAQAIVLTWGYKEWGFDRPHFHYTQGLTIEELKDGKQPSEARAKREYLSDLRRRLSIIGRALESPVVTERRKGRLLIAQRSLQRKIERIGVE